MGTYLNSRGTTLQPGDRERPPAPYPLFPAAIGLWLARGERLGQALRRTDCLRFRCFVMDGTQHVSERLGGPWSTTRIKVHPVTVFSPTLEHSTATGHQKEADGPFLHRILVGLIAATVISGAVTVALTSQHEPVERFEMANALGPV